MSNILVDCGGEEYKKFVTTIATRTGAVHMCTFPNFFKMPTNTLIQLGIDQSTSETGLVVKSYEDNKFICVFNFKNNGLTPKSYSKMLIDTLNKTFENSNIRRMVYESHSSIGENRYTSRVLKELAQSLDTLKRTCKGFKDAEIATEKPAAWRSSFIPKERYSGRYGKDSVKFAVLEECLERYPFLREFSQMCSKSYDSFEAIGILDGHLERNYTEAGIRIVTKSLDIDLNHLCAKHYEPWSTQDSLKSVLAKYSNLIESRGSLFAVYNDELTLDENARRMTTNTNKVVIMTIPKTTIEAVVTWETDIRLKDNESFALICYRAKTKTGNMLHSER